MTQRNMYFEPLVPRIFPRRYEFVTMTASDYERCHCSAPARACVLVCMLGLEQQCLYRKFGVRLGVMHTCIRAAHVPSARPICAISNAAVNIKSSRPHHVANSAHLGACKTSQARRLLLWTYALLSPHVILQRCRSKPTHTRYAP